MSVLFFSKTCTNFLNRYGRGDIAIFYSDALFHSIAPWVPHKMKIGDTITPGRMSWVFCTHKGVMEKYQEEDWEKYVYKPNFDVLEAEYGH